jgi:carbon monoxide dehydrogenase subunit G
MELSNTRTVPLPRPVVWAALNDPAVLKDCLPGCESLEADGEHAWRVVMAARVGPVSARFNGRMSMTDIHEPETYTLQFDGQGGAAGFARGDARVTLTPVAGDQTEMSYVAKAQIGGKLAQIGSRLVDGAAAKMADDFFARFVTRAAAPATETTVVTAPSVTADDATLLAPAGGQPWVRYAAIVAIVVVLILLYTRGYR